MLVYFIVGKILVWLYTGHSIIIGIPIAIGVG
jgi:hypothetical protein